MYMTDIRESDLQKESIKRFMDAHNLNIFSWCKKANVPQSSLRAYLKNPSRHNIGIVIIQRLARAVGTSADYIINFGRETPIKPKLSIDEESFDEACERLDKAMEQYEKSTGVKMTKKQMRDNLRAIYDYVLNEKNKIENQTPTSKKAH